MYIWDQYHIIMHRRCACYFELHLIPSVSKRSGKSLCENVYSVKSCRNINQEDQSNSLPPPCKASIPRAHNLQLVLDSLLALLDHEFTQQRLPEELNQRLDSWRTAWSRNHLIECPRHRNLSCTYLELSFGRASWLETSGPLQRVVLDISFYIKSVY